MLVPEYGKQNDDRPQRLSELFAKWGTDKGINGYADIYECLFYRCRLQIRSLLEVGIGTMIPGVHSSMVGFAQAGYRPGGSLRAWREYFPNAFIYGMDVQPDTQFDDEIRIATLLGDSSDASQVSSALRSSPHKSFDIIIDDGSHRCEDQLMTLANLFPFLRHTGIYVIEDLFVQDEMIKNPDRIRAISGESPFFLHRREMSHPGSSETLTGYQRSTLPEQVTGVTHRQQANWQPRARFPGGRHRWPSGSSDGHCSPC
jgi:hypothetical protein